MNLWRLFLASVREQFARRLSLLVASEEESWRRHTLGLVNNVVSSLQWAVDQHLIMLRSAQERGPEAVDLLPPFKLRGIDDLARGIDEHLQKSSPGTLVAVVQLLAEDIRNVNRAANDESLLLLGTWSDLHGEDFELYLHGFREFQAKLGTRTWAIPFERASTFSDDGPWQHQRLIEMMLGAFLREALIAAGLPPDF